MDYEPIRAGLSKAVPLVGHLGIELKSVGDGEGVALLPDRPELLNHVGSQHAAGLFAVAETASGAATMGAFFAHMAGVTPLAKSAEISYARIAKGAITAHAKLDGAAALIERLQADGRVEFPVAVDLRNSDEETVASMTVRWSLRKKG